MNLKIANAQASSPVEDHLTSLSELKQKVFENALFVSIAGASILLVASIFEFLAQGITPLINIIFTFLFLASLVAIKLIRNLSNYVQTIIMVGSAYLYAVWHLVLFGAVSDATLMLVYFFVLSAILFQKEIHYVLIAVGAITWFAFVGLYSFTTLNPILQIELAGYGSFWFVIAIYFVIIAALIIITINSYLKSTQNSIDYFDLLTSSVKVDNENLHSELQDNKDTLHKKLIYIRTATQIARSISTAKDVEAVLPVIADRMTNQLNLYYTGVFLIDPTGQYAVLIAGSGEAGQKMLLENHRFGVGGPSMIGWTTSHHRPRIALDVGEEATRFSNPHLPLTRSELSIPILSKNTILGAISIQSTKESAFDDDDVLIFQGIADNIATALENSRLFIQNQRDLEEILALNKQFLEQTWANIIPKEETLSYTFEDPNILSSDGEFKTIEFPIVLRDHEIGRLVVESPTKTITPEQFEFVDSVLSQSALALESSRLLLTANLRTAQEEKISLLTAKLTQMANVEDIIKTTLQEVNQIPEVTASTIKLFSEFEE
ncbi:MAG: GAF domain-containing protein [Anaerolineaceae bacterium]|nr:GAF domain-containing protein [Anaerolineaceae bacterium]